MTKLKTIFSLLAIALIIYACGDDNNFNNPFADIDHEALAVSDNDSLVKFLKNFYYDSSLDSLKEMTSGKTSLFDDTAKLKIVNVTENDIDYKLYAYVVEEGSPSPNPDKGNPTSVDSVFVKYSGNTLSGTDYGRSAFDSNTSGIWFSLTAVVRGWSYGFSNFKGGSLKKDANGGPFNGPITYLNSGKGYVFIPSGLAYPSSNTQNYSSALVDTNIMFHINLLDFVKDTDHDNDGVPTIMEDLDGDKSPNNDDTDSDGLPNFFDSDDDGDGVLTKDEDKNNDGDPTNDFNDPSNPTLPDYLNPNIK
jgi:FKBP-type peptidyl-prolyl cis-trans isomerase FkpA